MTTVGSFIHAKARPETDPTAAPLLLPAEPVSVHRTFGFLDLCGFTEYVERVGAGEAVECLASFRDLARKVSSHQGVRIAKWLGDGVMLVGVEGGPMTAAAVELTARVDQPLKLRAGLASGSCLLFEGDDYIGKPANLAARLCDVARPGEVLADANTGLLSPDWVAVGPPATRKIPSFGRVRGLVSLGLAEGVELPA